MAVVLVNEDSTLGDPHNDDFKKSATRDGSRSLCDAFASRSSSTSIYAGRSAGGVRHELTKIVVRLFDKHSP
jgi:hypothetical protein